MLTQPVCEHRAVLEQLGVSGFALAVSLVVGVGKATAAHRADVDEVYAVDGWDYVDLSMEAAPRDRLSDALMAHTWEGLRRCSAADHADDAEEAFSEFVEAPPLEEPTIEAVDALHARLGLGALNSETGPELFDRLRAEMERVRALPPGPARERDAALMALAVERALGG